ncbi:hypothetical protein PV08_11888 [Exophiala spinifera]|uniref:Uncharacterized protein n=1 Tax=Exophiala spinifera TaxID=91928 RepID=A0A0D2AST4_9EURO|nr:uncharacterized protein PV08_11888 [Exophiala spinifera]KIW09788.1 hypothetical protein PV08_11888 [Exophiala spinifera]
MSSYLVTGAGRGIGLELVRQLAKQPPGDVSTVFAATRGKASDTLKRIIDSSCGRVVHVSMVITDRSSLDRAASEVEDKLGGRGLDVLINNAGVMPSDVRGVVEMSTLRYALEVNLEGTQETTAAFMPLLKKGKGKKVVNMEVYPRSLGPLHPPLIGFSDTSFGSIAQAPKYNWIPTPSYKISKAALNMLTVQYAQEYAKEGFTIFALSPGWLKSDMGSERADLDVEVGTEATLDVIFKSTSENTNGTFQNILVPGWENAEGPNQYDGKMIPW